MGYWLLKSEPSSYGWDDLARDGATEWDGVRNNAAAGHLRSMRVGDEAIVYHSGEQRAVVGIVRVERAARADGDDARWVSVAIRAERPLPHPVSLARIKATPALAGMAMVRQSRLSVSPVSPAEWQALLALAEAG